MVRCPKVRSRGPTEAAVDGGHGGACRASACPGLCHPDGSPGHLLGLAPGEDRVLAEAPDDPSDPGRGRRAPPRGPWRGLWRWRGPARGLGHGGQEPVNTRHKKRRGFPIGSWMWLVMVMMVTTVASNHNRPSPTGGQGHGEHVQPPPPASPVGPPPPNQPRPLPGQLRPPAVDPYGAYDDDELPSEAPSGMSPGFLDWPALTPLDNHSEHGEEAGNVTKTPLFPKDLFTNEQRRRGAIALHVIGLVYMFVALAVVCDEFFVPALDVIIEKLDIADDVAGATFMAAGGSAPELFTSVIGVFVSFDDVGIGTIVGSAVFNILFVIGMCALFSRTVLTLTWWPLFRDCTFYSISLMALIYFFKDNLIQWWEALILFMVYMAYVSFMKWNQQVEKFVKKHLYKNKVTRVRSTDQLMPSHQSAAQTLHANPTTSSTTSVGGGSGAGGSSSGGSGARRGSSSSGPPGTKFRHGLLQLMIHTIDPLHDGKVDEKATQLHAIASLKVLLDATKPHNGAASTSAANHVGGLSETRLSVDQRDQPNGILGGPGGPATGDMTRRSTLPSQTELTGLNPGGDTEPDDVEPPEALDMGWPDTNRKRITYVLIAPIVFPLWLTLPDTRTPRGKRFFPVTFVGSICWIAAYSYLMVWWANLVGETARIPPEVMGLTFLAAGTSIPDLITSVIVARKGFGDMAVSSSVGSNIFDVTVGLPVPWLLYGIIYGKPVEVNSHGMVCSIAILFMMLLFVIMSIACFNWRMNKGLGFTMFLLYFVFVAVSLMFEYKYPYECPV